MQKLLKLSSHNPKFYDLNKKTLVFSFYLTDDFNEARANKIHKYYFNKFSHLFDECIITFLMDDTENEELLNACRAWLMEAIHSKTLTFKVLKNNYMCECNVFMNEIASKLDELYGLYFFGHNKGLTAYHFNPGSQNNLDIWASGLWYLNLNFINEVEFKMLYTSKLAFGAFTLDENTVEGEEPSTHYSGTFYWLNPSNIYLNYDGIPLLSQRGYTESFVKVLKESDKSSHEDICLPCLDMYYELELKIRDFFVSDEEYEDFMSVHEDMLNNIN